MIRVGHHVWGFLPWGFLLEKMGMRRMYIFSHILIILFEWMPPRMHAIRMVRVMYHLVYSNVSTGG